MYTITKQFSLVYGHRLWNQTEPPCQCRHLHGHSALLSIELTSDHLTSGMVLDFNCFSSFNELLNLLDHKMILDSHDPLVPILCALGDFSSRTVCDFTILSSDNSVSGELLGGLVLIPCEPTSEILCQMIFKMAQVGWGSGIQVVSVSLQETLNNRASYHE